MVFKTQFKNFELADQIETILSKTPKRNPKQLAKLTGAPEEKLKRALMNMRTAEAVICERKGILWEYSLAPIYSGVKLRAARSTDFQGIKFSDPFAWAAHHCLGART